MVKECIKNGLMYSPMGCIVLWYFALYFYLDRRTRDTVTFRLFLISVYEDKAVRDKLREFPKIMCIITGKGGGYNLRNALGGGGQLEGGVSLQ